MSIVKIIEEANCSICGYNKFETFNSRESAKCGNCGSLERTRALFDYLVNIIIPKRYDHIDDISILECAAHLNMKKSILNKFRNKVSRYKSFDISTRDSNDFMSDIVSLDNIPNNSIDIFICCHVIEHVKDYDEAIQCMYKKIKFNGTILIMVPFEGNDKTVAEKYIEINKNGHIWKFTKESFSLICKHNFGNISVINPNELFCKQYGNIKPESNTIFDFSG
jgi:hypothetical protein